MKLNSFDIALPLIGVLCVGFAFRLRNKRMRLVKNGVKTNGKIVDIKDNGDTRSPAYSPVVSFTTTANQTVLKTNAVFTNPCPYNIGDDVVVFYDPTDTDYFTLDDMPAVFVERLTFSIGIIAFCVLAVIIWLAD